MHFPGPVHGDQQKSIPFFGILKSLWKRWPFWFYGLPLGNGDFPLQSVNYQQVNPHGVVASTP